VLGDPSELARVAEETGARHVILAFSSQPDHALIPVVRECADRGIEISVVPRLFDSINVRVGLEHLGGLPLHGLRPLDTKGWQFAVKHSLDRALAAALIVVTAPLMLAVAVAVKLSSPGPVLFRQRRIGQDGREFEMLKFRSMHVSDDESVIDPTMIAALDTGPGGVEGLDRRTRVGSFVRRTSLDELPQLFNVLKGDMSIVGPRPERPIFAEAFGQSIRRYADRHRVKSGITGWAQVHGFTGQTSLGDRVEWDNFYIENWSLWLDFKIALLTVVAVLRTGDDA
jgi:exopolysaccharide biosynthesis polyprenyl glycosylphosphotransferase